MTPLNLTHSMRIPPDPVEADRFIRNWYRREARAKADRDVQRLCLLRFRGAGA